MKILPAFLFLIFFQLSVNGQPPKLVLPIGHTAAITSYVLTRDGKYLVTGSEDKTAKIWNFRTGRLMFDLVAHTGSIESVLLGTNEKFVVLASADGSYSKWDIQTGKLLFRSAIKRSIRGAFLVNNDSSIVLIKENVITIGSFDQDEPEYVMDETTEFIDGKTGIHFTVSHDKKTLAVLKPNGWLELFDISTQSRLGSNNRLFIDSTRYYNLGDNTPDIFFTGNGELVGIFDRSMIARFNTDGRQLSFLFKSIRNRKVNDEGTMMAYRSEKDDTVRIMNLGTFQTIGRFFNSGHKQLAGWLNDTLVMQGSQGLQYLDIHGTLLGKTSWNTDVPGIDFLQHMPVMLTHTSTGIEKRDLATGRPIHTFAGLIPPLKNAVYQGGSKWLFEIKEKQASYWDLHRMKVNSFPSFKEETVKKLYTLSTPNRVLIQFDSQLQLFDLEKGRVINGLDINYDCKVVVSKDGATYFTTSQDWLMQWRLSDAVSTRSWQMPHTISGWTLSPDEKLFAYHVSNGVDDSVHIVVLDADTKLASLPRKGQYIEKGFLVMYTPNYTPMLRISEDNRYLFFSSGDNGWLSIAKLPPVNNTNEDEAMETAEIVYEQGTLELFNDSYPIAIDNAKKMVLLTSDHENGTGSILALKYSDELRTSELAEDAQRAGYRLNYKDFQRILYLDQKNQLLYTVTKTEWLTWDLQTQKLLSHEPIKEGMTASSFDPSSKKLLLHSTAGIGLQSAGNNPGYYFYTLAGNEKVVLRSDGFYMADPAASRYFSWNVAERFYDFDQWDLAYNRPDKILEISADSASSLIAAYYNAYQKRLKRSQATISPGAEPYIRILNPEQDGDRVSSGTFTLKLALIPKAKGASINNILVSINGNPVYGTKGLAVTGKDKERELPLQLSVGENHIKVSCIDNFGIESTREQLVVTYYQQDERPSVTWFIGIGIDRFEQPAHNLQWCVKDIRDLAEAFSKNTTGTFIADTLFNEHVTKETISALRQKLLTAAVDDKVIIAYSGHGLLSKQFDYYLSTYPVDFNDPAKQGLPYQAFEDLLDGVPARKKLVLLDACHSGEVDKEDIEAIREADSSVKTGIKSTIVPVPRKDAMGVKSSFELMQELFLTVSMNTGAMVIAAAGGMQFAQERQGLANGVFTYAVLAFLRENPGGTVNELKRYVGKKVTELTHGMQVPTTRSEVLADWKL